MEHPCIFLPLSKDGYIVKHFETMTPIVQSLKGKIPTFYLLDRCVIITKVFDDDMLRKWHVLFYSIIWSANAQSVLPLGNQVLLYTVGSLYFISIKHIFTYLCFVKPINLHLI